MSFLTASWNDLAIINYEIAPEILEKYVPKGTEIDFWDNKCYISLIGFMFNNVKILGIKVPFHVNFEEVNLRFYVKRFENGCWKRGVVFVKEIVPKHAISMVANALYNEHYETMKMRHEIKESTNSKSFKYEFSKQKEWQSILMVTEKMPLEILQNSEAEFITEHYFGYTKFNEGKTIEYEVTHPKWKQLKVCETEVLVDFEKVYGKSFGFLQKAKPISSFFAIGSNITIEGKKIIKI
jgi:uncharacterized protein